MLRFKLAAVALVALALIVGVGLTQPVQPKGKKKKKQPAPPTIAQIIEPDPLKNDLRIVRENGLTGEGPDLLDYFRKRTLKAPDPKVISALVRQLGDEDFTTREKAFTTLIGLGTGAMAGIKEGENNPDLEIRKRVADLKNRIATKAEPMLQAAVARVIGKLKPEGAANVLMKYLPFSSDPMVVDEICKTLGEIAVTDGKLEPILVKSLNDPVAVTRGAAGEAIARADFKAQMPNVKKLLQDKDINVRYRVCMAMLTHKDPDIVPVLIDFLTDLSPAQLWPVEEALLRLAGDKAPNVSLGSDAAARKKCRDAWSKWYATNAKTIDMAKLSEGNVYLGYTLIVQYNNRIGGGGGGNVAEILELDKEKNVRWRITVPGGQNAAVDAQVLGNSRVLVAEFQAAKISERDVVKGEVKWEYFCGGNPISAQRLPNGNTFIAMQGRLIEVDRNKQQVWSFQRPNNDIFRARKLPGGEVAYVTNQGNLGTFIRMDAETKQIKQQFQVGGVQLVFGAMDVLPNGNVLLTHYQQNRVVEYDKDGKQVGNATTVQWPNSVVRLPSGNRLVTSYNQRFVREFANGTQEVWSYQTDGIVFAARRR